MTRYDLLVTGAGGFVGSHVVARAAAAGLSVRAALGDLADPGVMDAQVGETRPRGVIHLASRARPDTQDPWRALADDTAVCGALLAALNDHADDCHLLVAGSAAQYGLGASRPLHESDTPEPVSAYGAVKYALERALTASALTRRIRVTVTRSFNHVGPGQGLDAPVPQWARQIAQSERGDEPIIRTGRLDVVRDFLDVRDVADAYLALVQSKAHGAVNVCSGVAVIMREVLEMLVGLARADIRVEHDPALDRRADPPHIVGDPSRLRKLTGWSPSIPLQQSVQDVLVDWRASVSADSQHTREDAVAG